MMTVAMADAAVMMTDVVNAVIAAKSRLRPLHADAMALTFPSRTFRRIGFKDWMPLRQAVAAAAAAARVVL